MLVGLAGNNGVTPAALDHPGACTFDMLMVAADGGGCGWRPTNHTARLPTHCVSHIQYALRSMCATTKNQCNTHLLEMRMRPSLAASACCCGLRPAQMRSVKSSAGAISTNPATLSGWARARCRASQPPRELPAQGQGSAGLVAAAVNRAQAQETLGLMPGPLRACQGWQHGRGGNLLGQATCHVCQSSYGPCCTTHTYKDVLGGACQLCECRYRVLVPVTYVTALECARGTGEQQSMATRAR